MHIQDVPVHGDEIRLGQFIKLANLVETGGAAKEVIAAGQVTVNGEVDTRRGRRLRAGDVVGLVDPDATGGGPATAPTLTPVAAARVMASVTGEDGGDGGGEVADTDDYFDEATADDDFDPEKWRNL